MRARRKYRPLDPVVVLMFLGLILTSYRIARCSHGTRKCVPSLIALSLTPKRRDEVGITVSTEHQSRIVPKQPRYTALTLETVKDDGSRSSWYIVQRCLRNGET